MRPAGQRYGRGPRPTSIFWPAAASCIGRRRCQFVWGTGLDPAEPVGELDGERIWALRGKLTYALLKPEIAGLRDVPLGDPLYLVGRRAAALAPSRIITHRLGIVPQLVDRDHPAVGHLHGQEGVLLLDCAIRRRRSSRG